MNDLQTFWQRLHQNLNILREREAKYGGNAPLELLNQIEDHEKAIFLTRQRLDSLISEAAWREALKPLLLAVEPEAAEPGGSEKSSGGVTIGQVSGGIHDSTIAGRDVTQTTYHLGDSSDDDVVIIIQGDVHLGDSVQTGGDLRAALLNLKAGLSQVSQNVQASPGGTNDQKEELQRLIRQLGETLQQAPTDQIEAVEAVVQAAVQLVSMATRKRPNKRLLKTGSQNLVKAAQSLAETVPSVAALAAQIVEVVGKVSR